MAAGIFQSTHPVRGATCYQHLDADADGFQSTHPVRGATSNVTFKPGELDISIHAPREGCDPKQFCLFVQVLVISIHAPREGCDLTGTAFVSPVSHFNPRTP